MMIDLEIQIHVGQGQIIRYGSFFSLDHQTMFKVWNLSVKEFKAMVWRQIRKRAKVKN